MTLSKRHRADLKRRRGSAPKNKKTCQVCGERFQPATGFQKYCGAGCRKKAELVQRECEECGKTFKRARSTPIRFCSNTCANTATARKRKGKKGQFGNGTPKYPRTAVCAFCKAKYERREAA